MASFQEINDFIENNGKEPEPNSSNISEYQFYSRLKSLREDLQKVEQLKPHDIHNLLPEIATNQVNEPKAEYNKPEEISSLDDILGDDSLDILGGDDAGLLDFKHTPKDYERAQADFVAHRKPCKDLYKVGYSKTDVEERIKNAEKEPTYLMAPVRIKGVWKCFNMNPQKLEQLLHNFFGNSCLEIDVFDEKGKRHTPREWFIAPFEVIEQAIELIINGKIINYKYDNENFTIVEK